MSLTRRGTLAGRGLGGAKIGALPAPGEVPLARPRLRLSSKRIDNLVRDSGISGQFVYFEAHLGLLAIEGQFRSGADFPMNDILAGLAQALRLVVGFDPTLYEITLRSLAVTLSATLIASLIGLPLGAWLSVNRFRARRFVIATLNALMGLPPVVVGLVVFVIFSRSGPLGVLGLLFTTKVMVIAQVILITPIIASVAHQAIRELWAEYHDLLISLNATRFQRIKALLWDSRRALMTASLTGFGRAVGEVGAIMIVGGNIDHSTRVLTTAIALETGKGNFALALALGFVLIALALGVNYALHFLSRTERSSRW